MRNQPTSSVCAARQGRGTRWIWIILVVIMAPSAWTRANETLVPAGAVWRYLDNGSNAGTTWRGAAYDDSAWAMGPAQLGYGDNDEATVVRFGPNSNNRYITTYFRHRFNVTDPTIFTNVLLELLRDDGAVVYLNDVEVFRSNLPTGTIGYQTRASSSLSGEAESAFVPCVLPTAALRAGENLLAVEVHQAATNSTDLSFNLRLTGIRPPVTITLSAPANGTTVNQPGVTLSAQVSNPSGAPLTVRFHGRPAQPPGPDFTIVALPDTQYYVSTKNGGTPAMACAQTDWILTNRLSRNIAFTTLLGDCVENGDNGGDDIEWRNATNALYRLEDPARSLLPEGVPYGVAVGNHDQSPIGDADGSTTFYNRYFGEAHFAGRAYYGGHYGTNNDNHYQLFSASGLDFIVIHLEWDSTPDIAVLRWANALLQAHPHRRGIIVSHYLIGTGNPGAFGVQGQAIYDTLKTNANLFLMLAGHIPGEGRRTDVFNGNTVHTMLSDFQGRTNGGSGFMRLLEFSPSNNVIRVRTFSSTFNQYETDADSQFDLPCDLRPLGGYSTIATVDNVAPGTQVDAIWSDLSRATPFEWLVTASDGSSTVASPVNRFATVSPSPILTQITSPTDGATLSGPTNLTVEVNVSDASTLTKVELFNGTDKLGETTTTPCSFPLNLVAAGSYSFTAIAWNAWGPCAPSAPVVVTVTDTRSTLPPPTTPSGLTATSAGVGQVRLSWTGDYHTGTSYLLERSGNGGYFVTLAVLEPETRTYLDGGLQHGTTYTYRLRGVANGQYSEPSQTTIALAPVSAVPFRVTHAFDPATARLTLSWPVQSGVTYRVVGRDQIVGAPWSDLSDDIVGGAYDASWSEIISPNQTARFYAVRIVE